MHSSTDSHFRSACRMHVQLLLWHAFVPESCLEEQPHSHCSLPLLSRHARETENDREGERSLAQLLSSFRALIQRSS